MKGVCIYMFRKFFEYALTGAAISVGYLTALKVIDIASDPDERAEIKRKFDEIKNTIKS